jgi:DNA-binding GntR family transcriptional regulator
MSTDKPVSRRFSSLTDLIAQGLREQIVLRAEGGRTLGHGLVLQEIVEMRATLEGLNARLAAMRHSKRQIAHLQGILDQGMLLAGLGETEQLLRLNEAFHDALAEMADNPVLRDIVKSLRERTAAAFASANAGRGRQVWDEHAAIMRAVIAGNGELACFLALRHVYSAANMEPRA